MQKSSIKERLQNKRKEIGKKRRQAYLQKKRGQLKNANPTIISNNCIGGIVYHDLGLPFSSPTINLSMSTPDYLRFLRRLKEYLQCELTQVAEENVRYPVGRLSLGDESVTLNFVHYDTFADAKEKWEERCKRVDFDNLYVIFAYPYPVHPFRDTYVHFRNLPFRNKVMLTCPMGIFDRNVVPIPRSMESGKLLEYPKPYSKKRYMDRCNFVKFLNRGHATK